jgi:hypothetical protein
VALSDIVHLADCYVDHEGLSISGVPKPKKDELPNFDQLGLPNVFTRFREELDTLLSVI